MRTLVGFQRDRAQIGQIGSPSGGEGGDGTPPQLDLRAHVRRRAPRRPAQSLVGWGYAHGAMPGGAGGGGGKRRPAATLWSLLSQEGSPLRTQTLRLQRSTLPAYTEADAASHAASHAAGTRGRHAAPLRRWLAQARGRCPRHDARHDALQQRRASAAGPEARAR